MPWCGQAPWHSVFQRTTHAFAATIAEYLIYTFTSAMMTAAGLIYLLHTFDVPGSISIAARIVIWIAGVFLSSAAVAIVDRIYLIGAIVNSSVSFRESENIFGSTRKGFAHFLQLLTVPEFRSRVCF